MKWTVWIVKKYIEEAYTIYRRNFQLSSQFKGKYAWWKLKKKTTITAEKITFCAQKRGVFSHKNYFLPKKYLLHKNYCLNRKPHLTSENLLSHIKTTLRIQNLYFECNTASITKTSPASKNYHLHPKLIIPKTTSFF